MNNGSHLLHIARAGIELMSDGSPESDASLLIVLLDIEDILDKGRSLLLDESEARETRERINQDIDALRGRIREMLDKMERREARRLLEERGESLKKQFLVL